MKKFLMILVTVIGFAFSVNAGEASCKVPGTTAYVTAYNSGGKVYASNLADVPVTVTVKTSCGNHTVNLGAWEQGKEVENTANCMVQGVSNPICQ